MALGCVINCFKKDTMKKPYLTADERQEVRLETLKGDLIMLGFRWNQLFNKTPINILVNKLISKLNYFMQ